jgi:hypothetical protein
MFDDERRQLSVTSEMDTLEREFEDRAKSLERAFELFAVAFERHPPGALTRMAKTKPP